MCVWVCEADQRRMLCEWQVSTKLQQSSLTLNVLEHSCMPVSDGEGWNKAVWMSMTETRQSAMLLHSLTWLKGTLSATVQYAMSGGDQGGVPNQKLNSEPKPRTEN